MGEGLKAEIIFLRAIWKSAMVYGHENESTDKVRDIDITLPKGIFFFFYFHLLNHTWSM